MRKIIERLKDAFNDTASGLKSSFPTIAEALGKSDLDFSLAIISEARAIEEAVDERRYPQAGFPVSDDLSSLNQYVSLLRDANLLNGELKNSNFNNFKDNLEPELGAEALRILTRNGLLLKAKAETQKNFDTILGLSRKNLENLNEALKTLDGHPLLTQQSGQDNFEIIAQHTKLESLAKSIKTLSQNQLLTKGSMQGNFQAVAKHPNPESMANALALLKSSPLLEKYNKDDFDTSDKSHSDHMNLARAVVTLTDKGLLQGQQGSNNLEMAISHEDPKSLANTLGMLRFKNLLTESHGQENFNIVANHKNPKALNDLLLLLVKNEALTQDTLKTVAQHPNPKVLNNILNLLLENELLTQDNFKTVVEHQNPEALASALGILASKSFLCDKKQDWASVVDQVIKHKDTKSLESLLKTLSDALLLTKVILPRFSGHRSLTITQHIRTQMEYCSQ